MLRLKKLCLFPNRVADDDDDDKEVSSLDSGVKGLLSLDTTNNLRLQPTDEQLFSAHRCTLQTKQICDFDRIFTEKKFLQDDSLLQLARALIRPYKKRVTEDEDLAVFCLELLVGLTLGNRDTAGIIWQCVRKHVTSIIQSTVMPCALVEKALFGIIRMCRSLLPHKEEMANEILRLVLKLDAHLADAYCEQISRQVSHLVTTNVSHINSHMVWQTITSLLSITARNSVGFEAGYDALSFILSKRAHLSFANFTLCIDLARHYSECRFGQRAQSLKLLDLMANSVYCLTRWAQIAGKEVAGVRKKTFLKALIGDMWLSLLQALGKVCLDQREYVRKKSLYSLRVCLLCWDNIHLPDEIWIQCFDEVVFGVVDDLLEIVESKKHGNIEATLCFALKLVTEVFMNLINDPSQ